MGTSIHLQPHKSPGKCIIVFHQELLRGRKHNSFYPAFKFTQSCWFSRVDFLLRQISKKKSLGVKSELIPGYSYGKTDWLFIYSLSLSLSLSIYIYIYIYIIFYGVEIISMAIAMRNNNYLSLIIFKVKLHRQRLFFINEHDVGCSYFLKKLSTWCHLGVIERHVGCCHHAASWGV